MLRGFATISYYAADVAQAESWYSELLGIPAYFHAPGYAEFRVGDQQHELGIIDAEFAPASQSADAPGHGQLIYWHVDNIEESLARLLQLGAIEHAGIVERGHGFRTASVVDPFGNVLGVMENPHFSEMAASRAELTDAAAGELAG